MKTESEKPSKYRLARRWTDSTYNSYELVLQGCFEWSEVHESGEGYVHGEEVYGEEWRTLETVDLPLFEIG